ncbi:MAG: NADH-quinone oxidoreductase subunit NuoG [Rhodospirillaceae bacterium]
MPKLTIDGLEVVVEPGTSVLQACEQLGIEIPRFCYHERLSVAANCRMCLVEMERSPKPIASCAMPCADGMVIKTNSDLVTRARQGVMELILLNHPLDCPICDQGGECDLQDQAMAYGGEHTRSIEERRALTNKDLGPLVKTEMTRCILCTRCIRFSEEIAGVSVLGAVGRGTHTEVTNFVEQTIDSELSGNLIDVCPVGALTSKPYAFTARPWELRKTESVDVFDAVGSNIRIDARGAEVLRVLPRLNEDVNEEWIGDKTRFAVDGLKRQRIDRPYVRHNGKLQPASWDEAFAAIAARLKGVPGGRIAALAGDLVDVEAMTALKDLMAALGSANLDCRQDGARYDVAARAGYLFNSTIAGLEQADALLLIGTNPRIEAPIINARIRKRYRESTLQVALVGQPADLTYSYQHLGDGPEALAALADGSHPFAAVLKAAKHPALILGAGALARNDGAALQALARRIAETNGLVRDDWNGFNILHLAAARVGGLDIGFVPGGGGLDTRAIVEGAKSGAIEVVYLLGADEIDASRFGSTAFVIYQGHHGDRGAHRADVVLPGAAYTEKNATYVNTEGRVQRGRQAVFPVGEAREDWKILRALSERLGKSLPFDTLAQLRERMAALSPVFSVGEGLKPAPWQAFGAAGPVEPEVFKPAFENFYMTDPISRASVTMAKCTEAFVLSREGKTGTHG